MDEILVPAKQKMERTITALKAEFGSIRAGRANPAVLDKIRVDYYGTPTPINQMAAVAVAEARILTIQPWDVSTVHAIEKAIQSSDVGINPQSDGRTIRLIFPQLTEDHRKAIAKDIKKLAEEAKVSVRGTRRDMADKLKKLQKSAELTEDDLKDEEKELQTLTDQFIKEIDAAACAKEKEILEI
ncbi:MAG: ribosome recycling factor [Oscillospiraceae bacterium]|jgi:ribosome recycling factor|nr:ribosome recycling factor [Oscillospiraceae bacterium]